MSAIRPPIFALLLLAADLGSAETLRLEEAVSRLLQDSPLLKAAELEIEVQEAGKWQDSLYPNPAVSIEVDSFGGRKENRGFDCAEITYSVTQLILLGGKREARLKMDAANSSAASWNYQVAVQEALLEMVQAFLAAYVAQEKWALVQQQLELAKESSFCRKEQLEQGSVTSLQEKKAALGVCTSQIAVDLARNQFEGAKQELAALWGADEPDFDRLDYPLFTLSEPPPFAELEQMLSQSPDLAKAEMGVTAAIANTDLQEAISVPDLEVSFGVGAPHDFSDNDFYVSFTMPLPIFDRNQGNICRASLQSWQASYLREKAERLLHNSLKASYRAWVAAYQSARNYLDLEQSLSKETLQSMEESFIQGKVERQEWLEAKKSWLETKEQILNAAADTHYKKAQTLRLTAQLP
jgi:outer membrane protein, heavy metal efflux system